MFWQSRYAGIARTRWLRVILGDSGLRSRSRDCWCWETDRRCHWGGSTGGTRGGCKERQTNSSRGHRHCRDCHRCWSENPKKDTKLWKEMRCWKKSLYLYYRMWYNEIRPLTIYHYYHHLEHANRLDMGRILTYRLMRWSNGCCRLKNLRCNTNRNYYYYK